MSMVKVVQVPFGGHHAEAFGTGSDYGTGYGIGSPVPTRGENPFFAEAMLPGIAVVNLRWHLT